jgi:uncharacterized HhH-GPD family protein
MPETPVKLPITGDDTADRLLEESPLALVIGMLLDQQVPMEWAFSAPARLRERLGGLDAEKIAAMPAEEVEAAFREKPALHRYPAAMAKRAHELCQHVVDRYGGQVERMWQEAGSGRELWERIRALPGFGDEKARIFLALLAKRFAVTPEGWQEAAGPFADATPRSVADVHSPESLQEVRQFKKAQKAAKKGKADPPA